MSKNTVMLRKTHLRLMCMLVLAFFLFGQTSGVSASANLASGTTRYVATSGTDTGNCGSSSSPCRTIQYAVNQAVSSNAILVAQGTYTYNGAADLCTFLLTRAVVCVLDKNITILGGYSTSNWAVANPSANLTVISGANTYRGVAVIGYNTTTTNLDMEGFTIQNGIAQGPTYAGVPGGMGGGMWVQKAAVTLRDLIFKNNQAIGANTGSGAGGGADGAAIRIESSIAGTSSLIQRVTFDSNQSTGGVGPDRGGVAFGALFVYGSALTVENSTFTNNIARGGNSSGNGTASDGLNAHSHGGAIGIEQSSVTLNGIVATNNQAIGGNAATNAGGAFGGAIFAEDASSFVINDSTISGNTAQGGNASTGGFGAGGGILVVNSPTTIQRIQLISNSAIGGGSTGGGGGGLYLWKTRTNVNPSTTVNNTIIADNFVGPAGGGGGIQAQGLTANISHTTIAQNRLGGSAVAGQGLLVIEAPGVSSTTVNLNYSIVANHTVGGGGAVAVQVYAGNTLNINRDLFAGNNANTGGPGIINGSIISASSAGFVAPGSPNYDYHIRSDSAAKDQAIGSSATEDIDLQGRPSNNVSDIGADEYWPACVGNEKDTTGVFRPSNGLLYLKNSNCTGFADIAINYGIPGDYPVVGDWDGNGTATIGVYRNGQSLLRNSNTVGYADIVFAFGQPGDQPIAGDWNGDGKDTIGVYRPSTGQFLLRNSNSAGPADKSFYLGNVGDVAIAGDWTNKGYDTVGVFRPSNGIIFLKNTNETGFADIALNYGIPGDKPVVGDWDNNGTDTIGVYRNGTFYLRNSNTVGFADLVFSLGIPSDIPIAGNWDARP